MADENNNNINWMQLLQHMQGMSNPWLTAAGQAAPMLGGAIGALFDTQGNKEARWNFGQRKNLYDLFRWNKYGKTGPVIGNNQMNAFNANFLRSMAPIFAKMSGGASAMGASGSPDIKRMLANAMIAPTAQFNLDLNKYNVGMTENRNRAWEQLMAGLVGG